MGVGYMTIHNHGKDSVVLVAGDTPAAATVSIHETVSQDGLMKMRRLTSGLTIPAGETVALEPHSYHLMLEQLEAPLEPGDKIPLILTFDGLEPIEVRLHVDDQDAVPAMGQSDHSEH